MDVTSIFISALIVGLTGAMMPGPLLVVTIKETSRRNWMAGPFIVIGHAFLELVLVFLLVAGLSNLLVQPGVVGTVGVLGGLVLAWMGYTIFRDAIRGGLSMPELGTAQEQTGGVLPKRDSWFAISLAGIVVSLSHPYWVLWWATIGAGYVVLALAQGTAGVIAFYLGHIFADFGWYTLVAVLTVTGRRLMSDRFYRGMLGACAVFLVGLAGYFVHHGWETLFSSSLPIP